MPALAPKPFAEGEKLKAIKDLPDWAQKGFAGMETLNRIQSRVSHCLCLIRRGGCFSGWGDSPQNPEQDGPAWGTVTAREVVQYKVWVWPPSAAYSGVTGSAGFCWRVLLSNAVGLGHKQGCQSF